MQVILLNGPKRSGKDTIANQFIDNSNSARKMPLMWPMKLEAMAMYGAPPHRVENMEYAKDEPSALLGGLTPRQVYIQYAQVKREEDGQDSIADLWVRHAANYRGYGFLVVPDVRFQIEVDVISRAYGLSNVLLVRVHRPGFGWDGDIGEYCKAFLECDLTNAEPEGLGLKLHELVRKIML